jgi:hypothetical protein
VNRRKQSGDPSSGQCLCCRAVALPQRSGDAAQR